MPLTKNLDYISDITEPVLCQPVQTAFIAGDGQAHQIRLALTRSGAPENLEGLTVTGYVLRADDSTVVARGSVKDSRLCVTLPPACYAVPGRFHFILRTVREDVITTVLWLEGHISAATSDTFVDPGETFPSLDVLLSRLDTLVDAAEHAESAAATARDAAAQLPGDMDKLVRCYVQPSVPEHPACGDLWVTSANMESWDSLRDVNWTAISGSMWQHMLTADHPVLHVYDGFAWRTFSA